MLQNILESFSISILLLKNKLYVGMNGWWLFFKMCNWTSAEKQGMKNYFEHV
jgi:hypothetical protein